MKKNLPLLVAVTLLGTACSNISSLIPESKKIDYKSAVSRPPSLEVPPDLAPPQADERYAIPAAGRAGSATFSGYNNDKQQSPQARAQASSLLPDVDKVRIERSGNQRWLVVRNTPDKLWPILKEFWQDTGFIIKTELPEAGIMETDWAEDRAKIQEDGLRALLGKVIESLYSTGERDKFRTRLERGSEAGTTEIYISHRGMEEVYTNNASKDDTRWQPRPANPELEAEMLGRLMVRLGTEEKQANAMLAASKTALPERAHLNWSSDSGGSLDVQERFDRAWRRVGLALDRVGFTVEDRDRSAGIYFVRYVDPDADAQKKDDKTFLSKLAFWKGDDKAAEKAKGQYRLYVRDAGERSVVQVLTREGGTDKSDSAKKILNLLFEQLK